MSRKRIRYIHLFIWLFAIFANLPYTDLDRNMPPQQIVTYVFAFLYLMFGFYLFYLVLVPRFLERKNIAGFFTVSFFVVLIMPFFGYTILFLIRAVFDGTFAHFYRGYSFKMHMSGYFPVLTASVFGSFFRVIINWFTVLNQKAEIDRQRIAAELELLKSKLNPHFLFNTLNNIDSLIGQDPEKASSELIRLSDMMRYLTYETTAETVELAREVDYIRNYIELNRLRIKDADAISFEVDGDLSAMISPALFVPLLENAFKFASFKSGKPAISVTLSSANGIVTFGTSNYYDIMPGTEKSFSGFGISGLRKRLELIYPGRHEFQTVTGESQYFAKLQIDTNADQMHSNR
jgi:two-component system, LytTR family, sensor kinase